MRMRYNEQTQDYVCHGDPAHWVVVAVEPRADYSLLLTFADARGAYTTPCRCLKRQFTPRSKACPSF